jgi:hypothetical protein
VDRRDYYSFVREHHQDLIRIAQESRLIQGVRRGMPSAWDYLLARCGDLLISLGQRLKERVYRYPNPVELPLEPCVDCP